MGRDLIIEDNDVDSLALYNSLDLLDLPLPDERAGVILAKWTIDFGGRLQTERGAEALQLIELLESCGLQFTRQVSADEKSGPLKGSQVAQASLAWLCDFRFQILPLTRRRQAARSRGAFDLWIHDLGNGRCESSGSF